MSAHPQTLGKYEVLSVLGRGGMGIVYQAQDPVIGRIVAIKTISASHDLDEDELRQRLQMEARSAGRLQHPNIATVYDFGTHEGTAFIVLEYVEGTDLAKVIDDRIHLSLRQKLDILIQIAHGLSYAHELGVVHRDMKPSNIRLNKKGVPKIIDFGLARFDSTRLTKTGFMSGTIAYMSPERFEGEAGTSDDIFALGAIAYELLTYRRAFPGATPPEVMMKIMSGSLQPPSTVADVPPALDAVVLKATARDLTERYESAAAFGQALEDFLSSAEYTGLASGDEITQAWIPRRRSVGGFGGSEPTARLPTGQNAVATTVVGAAELTAEPTRIDSAIGPTADATVISPERVARRNARQRWLWTAAVIALVAAGGGFFLIRTDERAESPAPAMAVERTASSASLPAQVVTAGGPELTVGPAEPSPLEKEAEVQRRIFASLRADLASFDLSQGEKALVAEADHMARLAETKYAERNFAETTRLLSTGIGALRDLQRGHYERVRQRSPVVAKADPPSGRTKASPAAASPQPAPPAAIVQVPAPQPQVESRPPVAEQRPAAPSQKEIEREAAAFMNRVATAYEGRDVDFFRRHDANFNENTAKAVRSSPSKTVDMTIESIDATNRNAVRVRVIRTDTFGRSNIPPGVQRLVYTVDATGDAWRILGIDRP